MSELVEKKDDLIRYFEDGGKPRAQWRVGSEYEKVVVRNSDATAIPYSGAGGVEDLLRRMAADYGFEPEDEHGHILALKGERSAITLEPGGQVELSGEQCDSGDGDANREAGPEFRPSRQGTAAMRRDGDAWS